MKRNTKRIIRSITLSLALLLALLPAAGALAAPAAWYTDIFVYSNPTRTTYTVGEPFDGAGMQIAGHVQKADGGSAVYTLGNARYPTAPFTSPGIMTVPITCSCMSSTGEMRDLTTSVKVTVTQKTAQTPGVWATDIRVWQLPARLTYLQGEAFNAAGLCVIAYYKIKDTTPEYYTDDCTAKCRYSHGIFHEPGVQTVTVYCDLLNEQNVLETFETSFEVNVVAPGENPLFTSPKRLPDGQVGERYSYYIKATGTKPVTYGEYYNPGDPGALPDGLRLSSSGSGHIKGKPTKAGTFTFWAYAANDYGEDYRAFTITIKPAAIDSAVILNTADIKPMTGRTR